MNTNEARASATTLLFEDDPEIRQPRNQFLQDLGYAIALATDENDSLRLIDGDQPKVQLILLRK